jgi:uncharacterized protein YdaU (DUF1376 family)
MNYYSFHIGDYAKDTAHLSMLEDAAYRRLIDLYYTTESELPLDSHKLYRLVRAQSKAERLAVDIVVDEFFTRTETGWAHSRCDEEIAKAKESSDESEAKKANERERQRRHRERRKAVFEALRGYDIVPKWDTSLEHLEAMLSHEQQRAGNEPVTRDSTVTETDLRRLSNTQYPIPNTQEPKKVKNKAQAPFDPPDWIPREAWQGWLTMRTKKRTPNTEHALSLAVRDLEKLKALGDDPEEVLNRSTQRGWTGLFPINGQTHAKASSLPPERL